MVEEDDEIPDGSDDERLSDEDDDEFRPGSPCTGSDIDEDYVEGGIEDAEDAEIDSSAPGTSRGATRLVVFRLFIVCLHYSRRYTCGFYIQIKLFPCLIYLQDASLRRQSIFKEFFL